LTAESHQNKGLGTLVACAFIAHCLKHDLVPNWDCWTSNRPSVVLAEKLGFEARVEVPTYHGVRP
jgi:RimJ/RimL family protein N-acetyltransferase